MSFDEYETTFNEDELEYYSVFGADFNTLIHATNRKLQSNVATLISNISAATNFSSYQDQSIIYNQYAHKLSDVIYAIQNDESTVPTVENPNVRQPVAEICESMNQQVNNAYLVTAALDAIDQEASYGCDALTIFSNTVNDPEQPLSGSMKQELYSIVGSANLDLQAKAMAILQLVKIEDDPDHGGYVPEDTQYTTATPFWLLFGDLSINIYTLPTMWNNVINMFSKIITIIGKVTWKFGKKIASWFINKTNQVAKVGNRVSILNENGYPIADGKGFHTTFVYIGGDLTSPWGWAIPKLEAGCFINIAVPGGYVVVSLQKIENGNHYIDVWYRPIATSFMYELAHSERIDPLNINGHYNIEDFQNLYYAITHGDFNSDPRDYSITNEDVTETATMTHLSTAFIGSSWLFYIWCRALTYDEDYTYFRKFSQWRRYVWDSNDVTGWRTWLQDNSAVPSYAYATDIAETYVTRPIGGLNAPHITCAIERLAYYIGNHQNDEFSICWWYSSNFLDMGYHLSDPDEVSQGLQRAVIAGVAIAAIVVASVALVKLRNNLRAQATLRQARIDQALFAEDLDIDDVKDLIKQQKRVNLLSSLVGIPTDAASDTLSNFQVTTKTDESVLAILNLIK